MARIIPVKISETPKSVARNDRVLRTPFNHPGHEHDDQNQEKYRHDTL